MSNYNKKSIVQEVYSIKINYPLNVFFYFLPIVDKYKKNKIIGYHLFARTISFKAEFVPCCFSTPSTTRNLSTLLTEITIVISRTICCEY